MILNVKSKKWIVHVARTTATQGAENLLVGDDTQVKREMNQLSAIKRVRAPEIKPKFLESQCPEIATTTTKMAIIVSRGSIAIILTKVYAAPTLTNVDVDTPPNRIRRGSIAIILLAEAKTRRPIQIELTMMRSKANKVVVVVKMMIEEKAIKMTLMMDRIMINKIVSDWFHRIRNREEDAPSQQQTSLDDAAQTLALRPGNRIILPPSGESFMIGNIVSRTKL